MLTVNYLNTLISTWLPEPHAGLLSGILFGTKAMLSTELYNALQTTGTLHIVALSGTNITILINIMGYFLLTVLSKRVTSLLTVFIVIGFILFVGPSPSVIRAAIMGCISLIGVVSGRQIWGFWSYLIAVLSMLTLQSTLITDISFQLSAGATLGMLLFGSSKHLQGSTLQIADAYTSKDIKISQNDRNDHNYSAVQGSTLHISPNDALSQIIYIFTFIFWKILLNVKNEIDSSLRQTLSAQTFTIPIILFHFHRISLISPLPNILIGFILEILTFIGFVTVITGLIWWPLGQICAWFCWVPLEYMIQVIMWTSKIPMASVGF
jgi:competence protein ComEC